MLRAQRAIIACNDCPRLRTYCIEIGRVRKKAHSDDVYWARPVPGFGDPAARVLIIGLAPAAHGANRTGRVFTGDAPGGSGDFLMAAMHAHGFANQPTTRHRNDGLELRDAFIAATVRCAPPDNRPSPEEIAHCTRHLDAEFDALPNVRVIVALGKIAWDATFRLLARRRALEIRPRPRFAHGAIVSTTSGLTVIGSFHPSRQNTNTGRLTSRMMRGVFAAAARAVR
ncbi:MAG TPA: uracil-DNA glycosylase [Vicinamibacterales bacterium]|nr:uracil-DNA glycosylase [Vicinamibacterales bacterium]